MSRIDHINGPFIHDRVVAFTPSNERSCVNPVFQILLILTMFIGLKPYIISRKIIN